MKKIKNAFQTLKKIVALCDVELIAGALFVASFVICLHDGNYAGAFISALVVAVIALLGRRYYRRAIPAPVHSALRKRPARKPAKKAKRK